MSDFDWSNLAGWLNASFAQHEEEIALQFAEQTISYAELDQQSQHIANWLVREKRNEQFIGVYGTKEPFTYAVIAGIIRAGKAYVPLNPKFPSERNNKIISLSGIKTIAINSIHTNFQEAVKENNTVISFLSESVFSEEVPQFTVKIKNTDPAYLLFTSGSTGNPKGVVIAHRQVVAYLENISGIIAAGPGDKFSHTFDLTFDLSVHDIFCSLGSGATLCIPAENELLSASSYIKNNELSHWFSVPSVASMMDKLRQLKENNFPSLRNVLFCGEALPTDLALKFLSAIPEEAELYNLYGPTEATIAISSCLVTKEPLEKDGKISLGQIFSGHHFGIEEENEGEGKGELLLTGLQVIKNYFNNPDADKDSFLDEGNSICWYRTGDLVEVDEDNNIFYLGRKDTQVKLNGYRIELGEIEALVKAESGNVAVCFVKEGSSPLLVCVMEAEQNSDTSVLLEKIKGKLPAYMIPQQIVYLPVFPLNANGKTDRKEIIQKLSSAEQ